MEMRGKLQAPDALTRKNIPQHTVARRLSGPQGRSGRCGEETSDLCPESNFDYLIVQNGVYSLYKLNYHSTSRTFKQFLKY
jgi:hypothetical protein